MANKISGEDGLVLFGDSETITAATHAAGTVTVTVSGESDFATGDGVHISSVLGMTDLNGYFIITGNGDGNGSQFDVSLTTSQEYVSGGTAEEGIPVTTWTMEVAEELIDVTDSGSTSGVHEYIDSGQQEWNGSFEGFFQTTAKQLTEGNSITIQLEKDGTNYYSGSAIITRSGVTTDVPGAEAVKKSYDYKGDGALTHSAS